MHRAAKQETMLEIECLAGLRGRAPAHTLVLLGERQRMAIVHFLYRMVQDRQVAEELAMEVFERACRRGPDNAPQVTTRLFRMAADLALQEQPDRKARPTAGCAGDVCEEARRVVAGMPGKQRAAVLLHKYHQMDCGQIARILDCSEAAARLLLLAAYDLLRGRLALYETARNLDYIAQ